MLRQDFIIFGKWSGACFMEAPDGYLFVPFFVEPVDQMKFRKIRINSCSICCDTHQRVGQADPIVHIFDIRKTEVCQVSNDAMLLEFEINRQTAEDVEASTHPCD